MSCQCLVSEAPEPFLPAENVKITTNLSPPPPDLTTRLTSQEDPANELVPADVVEVHDHDVEGALPDLLPGNVEGEGLVEDRVEGALEYWGLALLYPLVAELEPHLDVRVWEMEKFGETTQVWWFLVIFL